MKLTRAILGIAIAATASALPRFNFGGNCANAVPDVDNLGTTQAAKQKRSHHPAPSSMNSLEAPQINSPGYEQDTSAMLASSGIQKDQAMHVEKTPKSHIDEQDASRSYAAKEMAYTQHTAMEGKRLNMANGATSSSSHCKDGLLVKIRNFFGSLRHTSQNQLHMDSQQEHGMQQRPAENMDNNNHKEALLGAQHDEAMPQDHILARSQMSQASVGMQDTEQQGNQKQEMEINTYREENHSQQQQQQQQQQKMQKQMQPQSA
ncbi:hypothetical protein C7999DRAFT_30536 [Corynascus novoguineensis]|uniref:Uncharacterized protein n=1 Tax=Corynascus novoguineensis TaxID=1126955 RepID=A0AAN7CVW1_9PEZI|nr:hypothetical protein C7999DRAFT_30536 [Corynascus novoguineensis]